MGFVLWLKTNIILVLIIIASLAAVVAVILTQVVKKKRYQRIVSKKEEKASGHKFIQVDNIEDSLTIQPMSDARNSAAKDIDDILNNL